MAGGGKAGGQGKEFTGSLALMLGFGPGDVLEKIENGTTEIWKGPIFRGDAMDGDGKTTLQTTIGKIHFYWGTDTQTVNALLAQLELDQGGGAFVVPMSAYPNIIYAVLEDVNFGQQENPPSLFFTISKFPSVLSLEVGVSRVNITDGGAGYADIPTVSFAGGGGTGAAAVATIQKGKVTKVTITDHGSGYTSAPSVSFTGGLIDDSGAVDATAQIQPSDGIVGGHIVQIRVTNAGTLYSEAPTVVITGPGEGAAAIAVISDSGHVRDILITDSGAGYDFTTTITLTGGRARDAEALSYAFHELNGDCILPEYIYEVLTNNLYGGQLATTNLHTQTFVDAAQTVMAEDLGVSPFLNENTTLRELIGKLLVYIDAVLYFKDGKIGIKLMRPEDASAAPLLDENCFTDELKPENQGFKETWSYTRLVFTDRENNFEQDEEPYDNSANADARGESAEKSFNYPFITRREVAKRVVKRIGLKGALPPYFYTGKLLPQYSTLQIGQLVRVSYGKYGFVELPARVVEKTIGSASQPEVDVKLVAELTRNTANDYVPPEDFFSTPGQVDDTGGSDWSFIPTQPRLMILPPDILENKKDGFLAAFQKTKPADRKAFVWFTYDPTKLAYKRVQTKTSWAISGFVISWHKVSVYGKLAITQKKFILRVKFPDEMDRTRFIKLIDGGEELYFVFGRRDVKLIGSPSNQHQVEGVWGLVPNGGYFRQLDDDLFDVQIQTAEFGWADFSLETLAAAAVMPTQLCYFGEQKNFAIVRNNKIFFERQGANGTNDDELKRRVKVTLANKKQKQLITDVPESAYDRDDTTMHPDGTYLPDWGPRSFTTYELFDSIEGDYFLSEAAFNFNIFADVDEAIMSIFWGQANDDENKFFSSIDQVLGVMFLNGTGIYSDAP